METLFINKIEQNSFYPLAISQLSTTFKPVLYFDEYLQRIIAKAMQQEDKKQRINLSLNFFPKKIANTHKVDLNIKESPVISDDMNTQVNVSINDENSLKYFLPEGVAV